MPNNKESAGVYKVFLDESQKLGRRLNHKLRGERNHQSRKERAGEAVWGQAEWCGPVVLFSIHNHPKAGIFRSFRFK
jgi:hypothetical protein